MNTLPDLGTLWEHSRHGLVMLLGIRTHCITSWGETLYTFDVFRIKDNFKTEGIFALSDWDAQFTFVA